MISTNDGYLMNTNKEVEGSGMYFILEFLEVSNANISGLKKKALHTGGFNFSIKTDLELWLRPRLGTMFYYNLSAFSLCCIAEKVNSTG